MGNQCNNQMLKHVVNASGAGDSPDMLQIEWPHNSQARLSYCVTSLNLERHDLEGDVKTETRYNCGRQLERLVYGRIIWLNVVGGPYPSNDDWVY